MKNNGSLVIAVYSPSEYYPPTLNAIEFLSEEYDRIYIVNRNYTSFDWIYPSNVEITATGRRLPVKEAEQAGIISKIFFFLQFTYSLFRTIRKAKANTLLICDYMPILSLYLLTPFIRCPRVLWYHNHDVGDKKYLRKWSISWFAWKSEWWIFPRLTLFSLPSIERRIYFPMHKLKGKFFFLPNFPSRKVYNTMFSQYGRKDLYGDIKILYQGSIGPLHGLEEIIPLLNEKIGGKNLLLVLKGFISKDYLTELQQLGGKHQVLDRLVYLPPTGYREVIRNSFSCHIGIGIHKKNDIMNNTLGTASNKIYEYAASGLPVLIYDNAHFRATLEGRRWVFFTDTSKTSLLRCLQEIISNYHALSEDARKDFADHLCFENYFKPILPFLQQVK